MGDEAEGFFFRGDEKDEGEYSSIVENDLDETEEDGKGEGKIPIHEGTGGHDILEENEETGIDIEGEGGGLPEDIAHAKEEEKEDDKEASHDEEDRDADEEEEEEADRLYKHKVEDGNGDPAEDGEDAGEDEED